MATILVAGAAGFIGSHLAERLLNEGHRVIGVDNFVSGSEDNLAVLKKHQQFSFIKQSVIEPLNSNEKLDQIYNLACPASPAHFQDDPISITKTCTIGVINLLELAKQHSATILQASTSEVYGEPEVHPQPETYRGNVNTHGPRSCYDEGKRVAESLFFDYHRKYQVQIKVARIFNTYGSRMDANDGRVVCNFVQQALKGEPITMFGDGSQTRSFCYVSDLVDGLIRLMNSKVGFTGPVNVGNPQERTVKDLAEIIVQMTASTSKFAFQPLPQDDPSRRCPDISLAKKELGWEPKVGIAEGLEQTIAYFKTKV